MKNEEKAIILSSENSPYEFDGKKGISHKIRLNIGGEIYAVTTTEAQVNEFKEYVGETGTVVVQFTSPKETLKMKILSFK